MATTVLLEEGLEIPLDLRSLADFRRWAQSDAFPDRGRIDYLSARIEVDMSPEDFFCHGTLKTEVVGVLHRLVKGNKLGYLVTDRTRVSCPAADLSVEPDVVFVSHASLASGGTCLVPKVGGAPGRFVELEGSPDLIVEIVSDHSAAKDTQRLPAAYYQAGVREFWLLDARREPLSFVIHVRSASGYLPAERDAEGFQLSAVFARRFRLDGRRDAQGRWSFDLREAPG